MWSKTSNFAAKYSVRYYKSCALVCLSEGGAKPQFMVQRKESGEIVCTCQTTNMEGTWSVYIGNNYDKKFILPILS